METKYILPANGLSLTDKKTAQQWMVKGHSLMNGKLQGSIPARGDATITPGTSSQTIEAGQYLEGTQTILGDAALVPGNIRSGVNIFGMAGTMDTTIKTQATHINNPLNTTRKVTLTVPPGTHQIVVIIAVIQSDQQSCSRDITITDNLGRNQYHVAFTTGAGAGDARTAIITNDNISALNISMYADGWATATSFCATYINF